MQEHMGLVYFWARRYKWLAEQNAVVDYEDLVQSGALGLLEAAKTFKPEEGKFSVWASYYIRSAILKTLGFVKRQPKLVPLDAPAYDDNETTIQETIPDTSLPDMDEGVLSDEIVCEVRAALDQLPEELRSVTQLHDLEGVPFAVCDEALGLRPGGAKAANARAFRLLSRNRRLHALLDTETRFHAHKGVKAFYSSGSSVVEDAVMWRLSRGVLDKQ